MSNNYLLDQFLSIHNRLCETEETIGRVKEKIFGLKTRIEDPITPYLNDGYFILQTLKFLKTGEELKLQLLLEQRKEFKKSFKDKLILLIQ